MFKKLALLCVAIYCSGALAQVAQQTQPVDLNEFIRQQNAALRAEEAAKQAAQQAAQASEQAARAAQEVLSTTSDSAVIQAAQEAAKKAAEYATQAANALKGAIDSATRSFQLPNGAGAYSVTGRSNDPFTFCTYGVPLDGWVSVNPLTGAWQPIRKYPNLQWIPVFQRICPMAMSQGGWTGPGSGEAFMGNAASPVPPLLPYPH